MRMGLGVIKLSPDAFWSMSPMEFHRAMEGHRMTIDPKYDPDAIERIDITTEDRRRLDEISKKNEARRGGATSIKDKPGALNLTDPKDFAKYKELMAKRRREGKE